MEAKDEKSFGKLSDGKQKGPITEFWTFLVLNKKWWLAPIVVMLVLIGALAVIGGSGVAPFIYSLF